MSLLRDALDAHHSELLPTSMLVGSLGRTIRDASGGLHAGMLCREALPPRTPASFLDPAVRTVACACLNALLLKDALLHKRVQEILPLLRLQRSTGFLRQALRAPLASPEATQQLIMAWGEAKSAQEATVPLSHQETWQALLQESGALVVHSQKIFRTPLCGLLFARSLTQRHYSVPESTKDASVCVLHVEAASLSLQEVEALASQKIYATSSRPELLVVPGFARRAVTSLFLRSSRACLAAPVGEVAPEVLEAFLALWDPHGPGFSWEDALAAALLVVEE